MHFSAMTMTIGVLQEQTKRAESPDTKRQPQFKQNACYCGKHNTVVDFCGFKVNYPLLFRGPALMASASAAASAAITAAA
ncbi:hypothetical protein Pan54_42000 [Rubinisphaera italica]|uniref:Uncharacterized protein n=1 Tax=Rubinisphaera italica TaxID=2527969 RepID=A0A5C5XJR9_9PLAN|nr:hypothetical protein Pan54_42000 [Rubinisphaera italica]